LLLLIFSRNEAITALSFSFCSTKISNRSTICKSLFLKTGPQIASPQSVTFAEGLQMEQIIEVCKFPDLQILQFAGLCRGSHFFGYTAENSHHLKDRVISKDPMF
jgi:hypothetical protein